MLTGKTKIGETIMKITNPAGTTFENTRAVKVNKHYGLDFTSNEKLEDWNSKLSYIVMVDENNIVSGRIYGNTIAEGTTWGQLNEPIDPSQIPIAAEPDEPVYTK